MNGDASTSLRDCHPEEFKRRSESDIRDGLFSACRHRPAYISSTKPGIRGRIREAER